jgi:glutathione S-transferase
VVVKLYWTAISHPSQAARKMLELKRVEYQVIDVLPLSQRLLLRLAGFRRGTVPALKLDGRRIQGSRQIARAVDELWPEPPLFPPDASLRARVEEAERWGEQQLQPIPRRLARFGASHDLAVRRWAADSVSLPGAGVMARVSAPLVRYYGRAHEPDGRRADEAGVRADLAALPGLLDRADALLEDGALGVDPPNAAALQILSTVRFLAEFTDLREFVDGRPAATKAREIFPNYPGPLPAFLPPAWLRALEAA